MAKSNHVWIVDDDKSIRWVLERALSRSGIQVDIFSDAESLLSEINSSVPDVIISDIRMPGMDGLEMLSKIVEKHPKLPVIVTTAHSDLYNAVSSYQGGAFEYLPKPFDIDEAVAMTRRALEHVDENRIATTTATSEEATDMIGKAPAMQEVFRAIGRLSQSNINVLIKNIIVNKHYNKNTFVKDNLNYIIELFFYNHINITKKISYKVKEYYYNKLLNIRKFNLDYETFFLEFEDNLLNG